MILPNPLLEGNRSYRKTVMTGVASNPRYGPRSRWPSFPLWDLGSIANRTIR